MKKTNFIIFTDLDGTLLDHSTYSFDAAEEALNRIKKYCIPLILCSSKTRAEIEIWKERLENSDPFISENGGAIFIPSILGPIKDKHIERDGYRVIELGIHYPKLIVRFKTLKDRFGNKIRGFSEMDMDEVVNLTGLSHREAVLAKHREYTEPFVFYGNDNEKKELDKSINNLNLKLTKGGRFFHLLGDNDKGKAVSIVAKMYKEIHPGVKTIALGDSFNDLPMLQTADIPILVQKSGGVYDRQIDMANLIRAPGIGPIGWNKALLMILS
ncbi:MAG: HAD-IIB family hydrolase [Pseudomonadota bacterium]